MARPGGTFVVVLDAGEEAFSTIGNFARQNGLSGASLSAIGGFARATVGWFDLVDKSYRKIRSSSNARY
jgi:predicted DNA-binding protein with PD1-like motif